jgi:hypothetical protein
VKLWIVVYIFGKVAMSVGPLPYDKIECEQRRLVKQEEVDAIFRTGIKLPKVQGDDREVTQADVRIACTESQERPTP